MDNDQQFCLKWNNYYSNLQLVFSKLYASEALVDCTLACDGFKIKCHKLVLSACSSYLEDLLLDNPCQHPIIVLKDVQYWELEAVVRFMYYGEVNVSQDKIGNLLNVAKALKIKGLAITDDEIDDQNIFTNHKNICKQSVVPTRSEENMKKREDSSLLGTVKKKARISNANDKIINCNEQSVNAKSDSVKLSSDSDHQIQNENDENSIAEQSNIFIESSETIIKCEKEDIKEDVNADYLYLTAENDPVDEIKNEQPSTSSIISLNSQPPGELRKSRSMRRKGYSEDTLQQCLQAVQNGLVSQLKASQLFGVPQPTISSILRRRKIYQQKDCEEICSDFSLVYAPEIAMTVFQCKEHDQVSSYKTTNNDKSEMKICSDRHNN